MTDHIDPTKEIFAKFRDMNRPGPIHMPNLVKLRKKAAYPDGREATARRPTSPTRGKAGLSSAASAGGRSGSASQNSC